ncbi:Heme:hemopexin utilization protein A [Bordetella ansorpii]|uniref:Heme:hemopexin utilization protein A n=1 Tax=Bordetella ansorpii TaxID=288768 RepID=A0A157S4H5_9BORD|nr:filamentous hemagglutinin N-terminal domain-containing protein [Bordetella ansorpii]SAI65320.1 Heme:hemopexin utilization protein A [Bordetella ansorpii]
MSSKKQARQDVRKTFILSAVSAALMGAGFGAAAQTPTVSDATVRGGNAAITAILNGLQINQTTDRAFIDWQKFGVSAGDLVQFIQNNANAIAVNRVTGPAASEILGQLQANGKLFLLNPNGILIGAGAEINVGSLLATTLKLSDDSQGAIDAFIANGSQLAFSDTAAGQKITNNGKITAADNGFVYLVATSVDNNGEIVAQLGKVTLAAGNKATIDLTGNNLINLSADALTATGTSGNKAGVTNSATGKITAGTVALTANQVSGLMSSLVSNEGIVEATSLVDVAGAEISQNGKIQGLTVGQDVGRVDTSLVATDSITTGANSVTKANDLRLEVTGAGKSVGAEGQALRVDAVTLTAKAASGHVVVTDVDGGVQLKEVTTGVVNGDTQYRAIITARNGAMTGLNGGTNVTAWAANLVSDQSIGTDGQAISTSVRSLAASTQDGSINIANTGGDLVLGAISAGQAVSTTNNGTTTTSSLLPISNADGTVTLSNQDPGTTKIRLTSDGNVTLGGALAAGAEIALETTGGSIVTTVASDDGGTTVSANASATLTAKRVDLKASGAIGSAGAAAQLRTESVAAAAGNGAVHLSDNNGLTVESITAQGTGNDVSVDVSQGNLRLGSIDAAGGNVTLTVGQGSVSDNNGDANNVTADTLEVRARNDIGSASNRLETSVRGLTTATTAVTAGTYIANDRALEDLNATTVRGTVAVSYTGGEAKYDNATKQLSAGGTLQTLALTAQDAINLRGNITAAKGLTLSALGSITQETGTLVTAEKIDAKATDAITFDRTAASTIKGAAGNGAFTVAQNTAATLTLDATAAGSAGDVTLGSTSGDLVIDNVKATRNVSLTATGSVQTAEDRRISGASVTVSGSSVGSAERALGTTTTGALNLTATNGNINAANIGSLTRLDAIANGTNTTIDLNLSADAALGVLQAGGEITLTMAGGATRATGSPAQNIIAGTLTANARSFGQTGDANAIQMQVDKLVIDTINGGIYVVNNGNRPLLVERATTAGSDGNVSIANRGGANAGIQVKKITAGSSTVTLASTGSIEDARDDKTAANITAGRLNVAADRGVGNNGELALDVNYLAASGGSGTVRAANTGAIIVDADSLQNKGASKVSITATDITILSQNGGTIRMDTGGSLELIATRGHIVFLNTADTIELWADAQGNGGDADLRALGESRLGYLGAIVAGNITSHGGDINLEAASNITIGLLDAGTTGNVSVISHKGIIIDGNGLTENIRGNVVTLEAHTPDLEDAKYVREVLGNNYTEKAAEVNSTQTMFNVYEAELRTYQRALAEAQAKLAAAQADANATQRDVNVLQAQVDALSATFQALNDVLTAAGIAKNAASFAAAGAQAIPFSGDGGADLVFAGIDLALSIAQTAVDVFQRLTLDPKEGELADMNNQLDQALAGVTTALGDMLKSQLDRDVTAESFNTISVALYRAQIARDAAMKVLEQGQTAVVLNKDIDSSAAKPLGISANQLNINGTLNTDLYLKSDSNLGLGNIAVASGKLIDATAANSIGVVGNVVSDKSITLKAGDDIVGAGGKLITPLLSMTAGRGIGDDVDGNPLTDNTVYTQTSTLAAQAADGGAYISNANGGALLTIGTAGAVSGVTAADSITLATDGELAVNQAIAGGNKTTDTVRLVSGGAITNGQDDVADVSGHRLEIVAKGNATLDTNVRQLAAGIDAPGNLSVVNTGGDLLVDTMALADGDASVKTSDNMTVGQVSLQGANRTATLEASEGISRDLGRTVSSSYISADNLVLKAGTYIGDTGVTSDQDRIRVSANNLTATGSGNIDIIEADNAELTDRELNVKRVATTDGNVSLVSTGNMNVDTIEASGAGKGVVLAAVDGQILNARADAQANITASTLAMRGHQGIGGTKALNVNVATLAADGGTGGIAVNDLAGDLTIGQLARANEAFSDVPPPPPFAPVIDDVIGLQATGDINVTAMGGKMTVSNAVATTGSDDLAGNIALQAATGLTQDATVTADRGDIALGTTRGALAQNAGITATEGKVDLTASTGNASSANRTGNITMAAGTTTSAGVGKAITYTADGDIAARTLTAGGNVDVTSNNGSVTQFNAITSTAGNIALTSGSAGGVTQNANTTATAGNVSVTGGSQGITMAAGTTTSAGAGKTIAYTADGDVSTQVLTAGGSINVTSNDGDIAQNAAITSATGNVALAALNGGISQQANTQATAGSVQVRAGLDGITMAQGTRSVAGTNGTLAYDASGNVLTYGLQAGRNVDVKSTDGNVTLQDQVQSATGDVAVSAGKHVAQNADVTATTGNVSATGGAEGITMAEGTRTTAGAARSVTYKAQGNIAVNDIRTTGGNVALTSDAGAILANAGVDQHVQAATLTAKAATGIGAGGSTLNTSVNQLTAENTGAGDINVSEADAISLEKLIAANGSVYLSAGGNISAKDVQATQGSAELYSDGRIEMGSADGRIQADTLYLTAQNGIDAATRANTINANAYGGGATIALRESGSTTLRSVRTDSGNIAVSAAGSIDVQSVNAGYGANNVSLQAGEAITQGEVRNNVLNRVALLSLPVSQANVVASNLQLSAGTGIGNGERGALVTDVKTIDASTATGNASIDQANAVTVSNLSTGGGDATLVVRQGDATVANVNATGNATLTTEAGSLQDDGNAGTRIVADSANLTASGNVNAGTNVNTLTANGQAIAIDEQDGLARLTATASNGDIDVTSRTGNVVVDQVNAGTQTASINAAQGSIRNAVQGSSAITAQNVLLNAGVGMGDANGALNLRTNVVSAQAGNGGAQLNNLNQGTLSLGNTSATGGNVVVNTAGQLAVNGNVSNTGGGDITLQAAGDVKQSGNVVAMRSGNVTVNSGGNIDMASSAKTSSGTGNITYAAANTVTVNSISTGQGGNVGTVTLRGQNVVNGNTSGNAVEGRVVNIDSPNANADLASSLLGDTRQLTVVRFSDLPVGGTLVEGGRFSNELIQAQEVLKPGIVNQLNDSIKLDPLNPRPMGKKLIDVSGL